MKYAPLLLLLACRTEKLIPYECGAKCEVEGSCHSGVWVCAEEPYCDIKMPSPEECNGIDDDCDGIVDEFVERYCDTVCGGGAQFCKSGLVEDGIGEWTACNAKQAQAEICNGIDDDCNGKIDDIEPQYCFGADPSHLAFGNCRPGVTRCQSGQTVCYGEILPAKELCNQVDDDCNGFIDDSLTKGDLDVVFIVDNSGSMVSMPQIVAEVDSLSYSGRSLLMVAPSPNPAQDGLAFVYAGFPDGASKIHDMWPTGGSREPTLDALKLTTTLNYINEKVIFLFTDEEPQSYGSPPLMPYDFHVDCYIVSKAPFWDGICTRIELSDMQDILIRESCK